MEIEDKWEGDAVPTTEWNADQQNEDEPPLARKIWNRFFGTFVSIVIGVYAGLTCRTMQEAWTYAALFCGEALICACIAGIIKTYSFKKSLSAFSIYFIISAVTTPVACWLGTQFA